MTTFRVLLLFTLSLCTKGLYECYFDYDEKCLPGLPSGSYVVLNETSDEPRLPASDVTAIGTYNDDGECFFPYELNSYQMYFCAKTDPDLPATCPSFNLTGPKLNCSEGEYGYEKFESGETGSRVHPVDIRRPLEAGEQCIGFYYYLSDNKSNASINVIVEDTVSNTNTTILSASERHENRWHEIRGDFYLYNENPTIYFEFQRGASLDSLPFYLAIDDIIINNFECAPINTTTIPTTTIITTTTSTSSTTTTTTTTPLTTSQTTTTTTVSASTSTKTTTTTVGSTRTTTSSGSTTTTTTTTTSPPTTSRTTSTSTITTNTPPSSSIQIQSNFPMLLFFFLFFLLKKILIQ
ncbi:unnamed protein product [Adineta ricciae]|uniref:MAM domain-containing protein n=1 Tax=Adineta ricciae TaxID=249248 RepID=A0A814XJ28_ADIRI|nr:unnamed protein product [Adineta ricciae]